MDSDGVLNHTETLQMLNVLLYVAKENRNSTIYKDLTKQEALKDLVNFTTLKGGCQQIKVMNESCCFLVVVHNIFFIFYILQDSQQLADLNVTLTAEDFMMWNVESSLKLLQPFLDLIFEVCHIVFGLWPQCRHMEHDIGNQF